MLYLELLGAEQEYDQGRYLYVPRVSFVPGVLPRAVSYILACLCKEEEEARMCANRFRRGPGRLSGGSPRRSVGGLSAMSSTGIGVRQLPGVASTNSTQNLTPRSLACAVSLSEKWFISNVNETRKSW